MFEINGRVTTAICYAKVIEDEAIEQIRRMCDYTRIIQDRYYVHIDMITKAVQNMRLE